MIKRIGLTSPIWSNAAYLFVWAGDIAFELQVIMTLLGVASTMFHYYEYKYKFIRGYSWSQFSMTKGYTWQRVDMALIYTLFSAITYFAGWEQVAIVTLMLMLFMDFGLRYDRIGIVGASAILAVIALIFSGAWLWVGLGLIVLIIAVYFREDAYTADTGYVKGSEPYYRSIRRNGNLHAIWHHISAIGLILLLTGASL